MGKKAVFQVTPALDGARGQSVLDLVQVAVVALDREGRVRLINRKGCEILGYETEEVIGRDWFENFLPARTRKNTSGVFHRLMADETEGAEYFENPILTKSGAERIVAWHNTILHDTDGRPSGTLSSGEDITERRESADALERSHKELNDIRHALDQAAIVAITDQRGIIRYANDRFCEVSKYSRDELLGRDHRIVNSGYHPKEFIRDLWSTIKSGKVWRGEFRNRAKDGSHYWMDTTIVPFLDDRGKPYQYLAIRSDITERKKAEEELRERRALAQLGQMAAVVAHEVKNPLAGIGGAIQIIGDRLPTESADREVIGSILERIDALNRKVEDLLAYSRPKPPTFTEVPLHLLLDEIIELLSRDPGLAEVTIRVRSAEAVVSGDPDLLRDVFVNLLLNSAQAMNGAGRIEVSVEVEQDRCRIDVKDDGPGISAPVRERVFEPFFSTRHSGTGLGLSIAKRVVEDHGGAISVACPPQGGTMVSLTLPLRQPASEEPATGG